MSDVNVDGLMAKLAGVAGAIVSMRFLQGTFIERSTMAVSGAVLSYFMSPYISMKTGLPEGFCGFLLGVFGMAVVSRVWEVIETTPIGEFWEIVLTRLRKWLGVKGSRK